MVDFEITPRGEVGLAPPRGGLSPFQYVDGIVVHYVGGNPMALNPTDAQSRATCRNIQHEAFNNTNEGYIDIQYNHLIDPNGNIFEGRGFGFKSAANGSANYNGHALGVCVLIGVNQPITQACQDALIWYEHEAVRLYPMISYVKPHSEVAPLGTFCPGDSGRVFVPVMSARLHETSPPVPAPPAPPKPKPPEEEIDMVILVAEHRPARVGTPGSFIAMKDQDSIDAFRKAGVKTVRVTTDDYDRLL